MLNLDELWGEKNKTTCGLEVEVSYRNLQGRN